MLDFLFSFCYSDQESFIDDTVVINGMMYTCKAMHDNLRFQYLLIISFIKPYSLDVHDDSFISTGSHTLLTFIIVNMA